MNDLALAGKCARPFGGVSAGSARAWPSRKSIAINAKPVNPMPVSTRKDRRLTPGQHVEVDRGTLMSRLLDRVFFSILPVPGYVRGLFSSRPLSWQAEGHPVTTREPERHKACVPQIEREPFHNFRFQRLLRENPLRRDRRSK